MSNDPMQLRREAAALHRAVFGEDIPSEIADRYVEAHSVVGAGIVGEGSAWTARLAEKGVDLEAIEIVLRRRQPNHVLCQKFKLLIYVAEAFPRYYTEFINERRRPVQAWTSLFMHGLRTVFKYVKGSLLLRAWA